MEDHELISQLPLRERLFLYAKGARAMVAPSAVFPLGLATAWVYGCFHWFSRAYFSQWAWANALPLMLGVIVVSIAAAGAMVVHGALAKAMGREVGGRWLPALICLACIGAMGSPWTKERATVAQTDFEKAYAHDTAAFDGAVRLPPPESEAMWRDVWGRGEMAVLLQCNGCMGDGRSEEEAKAHAWPTLPEAEEVAREHNSFSFAIAGLLCMVAACVAEAFAGAALGLALAGWDFARRMLGPGLRQRSKAALARCAQAPGSAWGAVQGAARMTAGKLGQAALSDPQERAQYERRALEAASRAADKGVEGSPRL